MSVTRESIEKEIIRVFQSVCNDDLVIGENTVIAEDLGVDSVAIMDAIMELEEVYDIDIPMNDLANVHAIKDLVDYLDKRIIG